MLLFIGIMPLEPLFKFEFILIRLFSEILANFQQAGN